MACHPVTKWSKAALLSANEDRQALPANSVLRLMMFDYGQMRDRERECAGLDPLEARE